MLENWRFNRGKNTAEKYPESSQVFLDQEYLTQRALDYLGANEWSYPSEVRKVGGMFMAPEQLLSLRVPYAVEVLGMPGAGKTTMINRYLEGLWKRGERNRVHMINEGVRAIKGQYGDLRYTDPFLYSMLGGSQTFLDYIFSLKKMISGLRMVASDRGQVDRRVFRRALFNRGDVNPQIMANEAEFIDRLENTPIQIGGIIMFMVKPETSIKRIGKEGPVVNMNFLPRLYEQYWRTHLELLQGEIPYRIYTCIDAEQDQDSIYEHFEYAMDTTLNIHQTILAAMAQAFPSEYETSKAEHDKNRGSMSPLRQELSKKLSGRVLIVGGDDMEKEEDILDNLLLEGYRTEDL